MHAEAAAALRLAELTAARLCHDFSGLSGTLANALEMVNDPAMQEEALAIATDGAGALRDRLRLLRAAWGGTLGEVGIEDLRDLAAGLPGKARPDFRALPADLRLAPAWGRLALNALLLAAEALPAGGSIRLSPDGQDGLLVIPDGPRAAWPAGFAALAADPDNSNYATIAPRGVQALLTVLLARAHGIRLSFLLAPAAAGAPPLRLSAA